MPSQILPVNLTNITTTSVLQSTSEALVLRFLCQIFHRIICICLPKRYIKNIRFFFLIYLKPNPFGQISYFLHLARNYLELLVIVQGVCSYLFPLRRFIHFIFLIIYLIYILSHNINVTTLINRKKRTK